MRAMVSFSGVLTAATAGWLLASIPTTAAIAHEHEHEHEHEHGHERFVAVETGAILSPRQYNMRPAHALLDKRQGGCNPDSHPCSLATSLSLTFPPSQPQPITNNRG
jgi:hypothetical protein